jgi:hypothetical protein
MKGDNEFESYYRGIIYTLQTPELSALRQIPIIGLITLRGILICDGRGSKKEIRYIIVIDVFSLTKKKLSKCENAISIITIEKLLILNSFITVTDSIFARQ